MIGTKASNKCTLIDPYRPLPDLIILLFAKFAKIVGHFGGPKGAKS